MAFEMSESPLSAKRIKCGSAATTTHLSETRHEENAIIKWSTIERFLSLAISQAHLKERKVRQEEDVAAAVRWARKVALDTNVLVSALGWKGNPHKIFKKVIAGA